MVDWSPLNGQLCTAAQKNITFWKLTGGGAQWKLSKANGSGAQDAGKVIAQLCVAHDSEGNVFSGANNGSICKWGKEGKGNLVNEIKEAHNGVIHCIRYVEQGYKGQNVLVSGGTDCFVHITDAQTLTIVRSLIQDGIPRSVDLQKYLLVGLRNGSIVESDIESNQKETIMYSHHDGEVWGLCLIN
jgi:WD40 repeat protein